MRSKSNTASAPVDFTGSPLEVATLAAVFLPKLALPEHWERALPETLRNDFEMPLPQNAPPEQAMGLRTGWEVLCEEAVKRARTLLNIAAGGTRTAVVARDKDVTKFQTELDQEAETFLDLRKKFDKLSNGRSSLPVAEVLKFCLPRARTDKVRMHHFRTYLLESAKKYNARHGIDEKPAIKDQAGRTVDRQEFPRFVKEFKFAHAARCEAWRKKFERTAGRNGGKEAQDRKSNAESVDVTTLPFSKSDNALLDKAAKKAMPATK